MEQIAFYCLYTLYVWAKNICMVLQQKAVRTKNRGLTLGLLPPIAPGRMDPVS